MKRLTVFLICVITICTTSFAYNEIHNGIMLIGSNQKNFDIKTLDNKDGIINYNVELYTDGTSKQYCLRFAFNQNKHFLMIRTHATVLIKTKTGDTIELRALYAYDDPSSIKVGYAYFPITEEQLSDISNNGVLKFRIQAMADTDHHSTYVERIFKADIIGANIRRMTNEVDREWEKTKNKYFSTKKDIKEDF